MWTQTPQNVDKKEITITYGPLNSIIVWAKIVYIYQDSINIMLHDPEYSASTTIGLFGGKHHGLPLMLR